VPPEAQVYISYACMMMIYLAATSALYVCRLPCTPHQQYVAAQEVQLKMFWLVKRYLTGASTLDPLAGSPALQLNL